MIVNGWRWSGMATTASTEMTATGSMLAVVRRWQATDAVAVGAGDGGRRPRPHLR
jgi:hypothetical protein